MQSPLLILESLMWRDGYIHTDMFLYHKVIHVANKSDIHLLTVLIEYFGPYIAKFWLTNLPP